MPAFFIRIRFEPSGQFGPGKAALLEQIAATGSIRKAAAAMKMSYRRAWLLLQEIEKLFGAPVIARTTGGAKGGGAALTPLGKSLIRRFRSIERRAASAAQADIDAMARLMRRPMATRR
ncbi:MAG: LysR family transcriptional regulator [Alphaproteobacteria bacterium]|nr:LysR family transcriptional regulator [Alphaproteobacteria bacterium]MBL6938949.1 LysR family transcriptional regulator [Alphaproteobacteria bacterium]MBL7099541.1 LysR family transcriptional regulator [Alphaproteobacteria bacterium]